MAASAHAGNEGAGLFGADSAVPGLDGVYEPFVKLDAQFNRIILSRESLFMRDFLVAGEIQGGTIPRVQVVK
jgi:hypothetical protein